MHWESVQKKRSHNHRERMNTSNGDSVTGGFKPLRERGGPHCTGQPTLRAAQRAPSDSKVARFQHCSANTWSRCWNRSCLLPGALGSSRFQDDKLSTLFWKVLGPMLESEPPGAPVICKSAKLLCYKGSGSIQCSPEVEPLINQMLFKQNLQNASFLEVWTAGGHQRKKKKQNISD